MVRAFFILVFACLVSQVLAAEIAFPAGGAHAYADVTASAPSDVPARMIQPERGDYPRFGGGSPRVLVWALAQMHLFLAAFVLAVPLFSLVLEFLGIVTRDRRFDAIAREFLKISMAAYSLTALAGGAMTLALFAFYPHLMDFLMKVFRGQSLVYAGIFGLETLFLYLYYYSWDALRSGNRKWVHMSLGLGLNVAGLTLMFIANAWTTFMMSPAGVDAAGVVTGSVWEATHNPLWNALNLHRFLANIAYGGAIVGAFAAWRFLTAATEAERAHYDWMGYTSNFIAVAGFLPLPFAGYWFTAEIYAYSQQMGITAMGGILAWLFIIQAVLIGVIVLGANYYLWCGLMRSERGTEYARYVKYIAAVIVGGFLVWVTPHSLVLTPSEIQVLGGTSHPVLGPLGLMPAKNTAVNLMLVFTFLSFQMFYRSTRRPVVSWAKTGNTIIIALYCVGCLNIIVAGIYGYVTPSVYKVGSSVPQVLTTLSIIIFSIVIDAFMLRGATREKVAWGRMSDRSQYALFVLPVAFTWLMALMGYVRSSLRMNWHVYGVMKDKSPDAYIPTIGDAGNVITLVTLLFMAVMVFVFWISSQGTPQRIPLDMSEGRT